MKNAKEYENLYYSAVARSEADWLVGINATRALTCKYNAQLSCGRVQTPTLAMIASREDEIKHFQPQPFYSLEVQTEGITWKWQKGNSFDLNKVKDVQTKLNGKDLKIVDIKKAHKKLILLNYTI